MTEIENVLGDSKSLVYLRNPIATAKYKLSHTQQKVFLEMALLAKRYPDTIIYKLYIIDFLKKINANTNEKSALKQQIADMATVPIYINTTSRGSMVNATIFASVERFADNPREYVEIEISHKLKPFFIEFAEGEYFKYEIQNTRQLKSVYSIRMYLYLKSWKRVGKATISYQDLRLATGVEEDEYKLFGDFHKRVIKTAYDELREKTDISFDYTLERERKRSKSSPVARIHFKIYDNGLPIPDTQEPQLIIPLVEPDTDTELLLLAKKMENNISENELTPMVVMYGRERILDVLHLASDQVHKGIQIKSLIAFMHTALKNESGKGKSKALLEKRKQAELVNMHKEIDLILQRGLNDFKNQYFTSLGKHADQPIKDKFFASIQQDIAQNPNLVKIYKNERQEWNAELLQNSLGIHLNTKSDDEFAMMFMESLGKPIHRIKGFWSYI